MIIECVNCNKKFNVNSELIPSEGRTIQCGSCNHIWFFNPKDEILVSEIKKIQEDNKPTTTIKKETKITQTNLDKKTNKVINKSKFKTVENKSSEIVKYQPKTSFSFIKFLSYILVLIITFIALIIILDTFKTTLFSFYPNLEFLLFSLFETLKDIQLFVKDLF